VLVTGTSTCADTLAAKRISGIASPILPTLIFVEPLLNVESKSAIAL
jgi:hypothetical protein